MENSEDWEIAHQLPLQARPEERYLTANSRLARNENKTKCILPPLSLLERLRFAPNSSVPKWHKGILCLCCSFLLILFLCSNVGPTHGRQSFTNMFSMGPFHRVQPFRAAQPGSLTGCSACKKFAPAWAPSHRPWLLPGACQGCRVKICSAMHLLCCVISKLGL